MNNAPTVYVPIEPEGNSLTLPTLLSVLAHGIVFGILLYTYHSPQLEVVGSIETTMVSPGELAQMQGQILANRAASAQAAASGGQLAVEQTNTTDDGTSSSSSQTANSQRVPVFIRSDEPADQNMLMSSEQQQRLAEQSAEYERNMAEWASQLDESTMDRLNQVEQNKRQDIQEERQRLQEFREKNTSSTMPNVRRPTSTDRNIEIETGSSGAGKNFSLSDGESTSSLSSSASNSSQNAGGGSRGASNSEIVSRIKRNYNPPTAARGTTQRATLTITVNANGDVVRVSASGADNAVNEAARQAVLSTGNLPIDTDDPKYPTFTLQFNGSN